MAPKNNSNKQAFFTVSLLTCTNLPFIECAYGQGRGFPCGSVVKSLRAMQELQETQVPSLSQEDPLEEGMATHSGILPWEIPWTEEPGGLQSMGLQKRHD